MSNYIKKGMEALLETRAGGPLLPLNTQMARRGVKVYNPIRDTGGPNPKRAIPDVDDPNVPAAARYKRVGKSTHPLDQQQINLKVSPKTVRDTIKVAGGGAGVGAAVLAKDALDKRGQQSEQTQEPGVYENTNKKEQNAIIEAMKQIREAHLPEQTDSTYFTLGGGYSPYMAARKMQSKHFKPGGYDLNYNPFKQEADGSQGVTATRTSRNRKTDMYKDPAGNIHVGQEVDRPGFTLTPGLGYISGTGQSTKEFDAGMRQARRRNVQQAGASRAMATMRNIRDRLRHQNADMVGD